MQHSQFCVHHVNAAPTGGPTCNPAFSGRQRFQGNLKVAQRVPSPSGHRNENQHKANRSWDVNVRCWKYIKLKAFGLVSGWVLFFGFFFVRWHLTPFIICTLHHWNPISYLLNSGTNGWLVHIMLLTAWCCPCAEERGDERQSSLLWNCVISAERSCKVQQFVPDLWSKKFVQTYEPWIEIEKQGLQVQGRDFQHLLPVPRFNIIN